jgi:hypothetical protein
MHSTERPQSLERTKGWWKIGNNAKAAKMKR